jgi:uncharacterized protein (TIGR03435 family)
MPDATDMELLRDYARKDSEPAFAEIVHRHLSFVFSIALRHVGIAAQAEEITQAVFVILARKAGELRPDTVLEGWLYRTTRLTSLSFMRTERRRQFREQEAYMQSTLDETGNAQVWEQLAPLLDEAMTRLGQKDRDALTLRFFKDKNLREVAAALGTNEAAAQKRVLRGLEKLRAFFVRRGVVLTTAVIAGAISANSVQAAPAGLAAAVAAATVAKGAAAGASTLTLVKGALKLMAWTKAKLAVAVALGAILTAGVTTVAVAEFTSPSVEDIFKHHSEARYLEKAPAVVVLRPSRYRDLSGFQHMHGPPESVASERFVALGQPFVMALSAAYDVGPEQMVLPQDLPTGPFEFLSAVPDDPKGALRDEIKRQFGLVGRLETRETDVLVLKLVNPAAPGLKVNRSRSTEHGASAEAGHLRLVNFKMSYTTGVNRDNSIVRILGGAYLGVPVIDETGLTDSYDIDIHWTPKLRGADKRQEEINRVLREQLGLELVPDRRKVEMLVVEYENPHQVEPPLPIASWASVGYATPEDAFQSALWAMRQPDPKAYLAALTPTYQKHVVQADWKKYSQIKIAAANNHKATQIAAFQVLSKEIISDDECVLYVRSTRLGDGRVRMKNINGEWKMDQEIEH